MLPQITLPRINTGSFIFGDVAQFAGDLFPVAPEPHHKQQDFATSPQKRKVVVSGRRGGKTTGFAIMAAEALTRNRRVLYAGPTVDQTERFWYAVRSYFEADVDAGRLIKSETRRLLEPPGVDENGPRIRAKTAHNADTMRGDWGDLVMLDEYQLMSPDVDTVTAPMMLDTNGDLVYGGTPQRRNHFYHKYLGANQQPERWGVWHFTSHDNPHLSSDALKEITQDMTENDYRQEIMAEFLEGQGSVFRNIAACLNAPLDARPEDHKGHRIVIGTDWGKHQDFNCSSVFCADCGEELELDRSNQLDYIIQRGRLEHLYSKWGVGYGLAESNSMGEPNLEMLWQAELPVDGFAMTATSKPPLIESLVLAFEREEAQWLNVPVATMELEAFEQKLTATGRSQYSAPSGMHDDTVIARAITWRAATNSGGIFAW